MECVRKIVLMIMFVTSCVCIYAQTGNNIRGVVIDNASNIGLPYASIVVIDLNQGAVSDSSGNFILHNIPIGRHDIQISYVGYETILLNEVMVSSGKEVYLKIALKENAYTLGETIINAKIDKEQPLNQMATVSARMLSTEESSRYAGGFDDPARLVSSFAGVAGNLSSNGIAIRGNSPQYLQWRLEGVEIPNPTHFSDITGVGGGILTALSNNVLGNSDFFTGAFPAEYNNTISGVFDMQMRTGNSWDYEHTIQIGTLGVDIASEGPLKKGHQGSYLFNYRYSSMALADDLFPGALGNAAGMRYQDLSFKINLPSSKYGTFSIWGIGVADRFVNSITEKEVSEWNSENDQIIANSKQYMAATGIGHKYFFNNTMYLKTAIATSFNFNEIKCEWADFDRQIYETARMKGGNPSIVLSSYINKKFGSRHTNRTGVSVTKLFYSINYKQTPEFPYPSSQMIQFAKGDGGTYLYSAFSQSSFQINEKTVANVGLTSQFFTLNNNFTLEPRIGLNYKINSKLSTGFAYGMHSRHEKLDYYFVTINNQFVNKKLKLSKAQHFVLSFDWNITKNLHLKIEPYFQYLYDLPVAPSGSYALVNETQFFIFNELESKGRGKNIGIDFSLEKYLSKGYYYMFTTSIFSSHYRDADGVWRNTAFNRNFLTNLLFGKEWVLGKQKQNIFGINLRLTYQGGERYTPVNELASIQQQQVIYDENRAFEKQLNPALISSVTINYKINKKKVSHEFAIKVINATAYKEFSGYIYNYKTQSVEVLRESILIPNISYKIDF